MSDETETTEEGPRQTVRRMPDDQPEIGPFFPSGMNTVEAALAGATANMTEEQVAALKGEQPAEEQE
jgi:hypothetical protein